MTISHLIIRNFPKKKKEKEITWHRILKKMLNIKILYLKSP